MDGWMDERMDRPTREFIDGITDGTMDRLIDGSIDRETRIKNEGLKKEKRVSKDWTMAVVLGLLFIDAITHSLIAHLSRNP